MKIYNVDSVKQFEYKRNDYQRSDKWKEDASKRKLIYGIGIGGGAAFCAIMSTITRAEAWVIPLVTFSGGFLGWIPGLSYSKLSGAKCLEIGTIEKRRDDIVLIDDNNIRYIYNENIGTTSKLDGYKVNLSKIRSITYKKDRDLLTITGTASEIVYDIKNSKDHYERRSNSKIIKMPMYFENNEELIKDIEESIGKVQEGFKIKYI